MNREKLELTKEEALALIWGDHDPEKFKIVEKNLVDTTRWSLIYDIVVQRLSDGKFFADGYSVGATESQDERPYEWTEPNFLEVKPVEKTIINYTWPKT